MEHFSRQPTLGLQAHLGPQIIPRRTYPMLLMMVGRKIEMQYSGMKFPKVMRQLTQIFQSLNASFMNFV